MAENKRYYWLQLKENFFKQPRIKKLRKMAGGDTYTIIYLKMQLLSLQNGGKLIYEGIEENFSDEVALNIDENQQDVKMAILYLIEQGLIVEGEIDEYSLPETMNSIGSETASTIRSKRSRSKKALQCNTDATSLQHDATKCNGDIDIEIHIDKDINTSVGAESNSNTESKESPIITLTLNDKSEYGVDRKQVQEWQELYPAVDIIQELRKMKGWLNANPTKRKTRRGITRFINGWLSREQDKGRTVRTNYVSAEQKQLPTWFNDQDIVKQSAEISEDELQDMLKQLG